MKKLLLLIALFISSVSLPGFKPEDNNCRDDSRWQLVWEEDFNVEGEINPVYWSKISRGPSDWNNYMADHDSLFGVTDGCLILRGVVNGDRSIDTVPFLTGGITTQGKKAFANGKLEVKAKFGNVQGAWPAIWLLPFEPARWPMGGEIDIMERLNADTFAYQTVHSHYTQNLGLGKEPPHSATGTIKNDEFNIYGVEMYPDSLVFSINGVKTFTYPRIETDKEGQFPFDRKFYLNIDMQIEGKWVGKADPAQLPDTMFIDWVRFYELK